MTRTSCGEKAGQEEKFLETHEKVVDDEEFDEDTKCGLWFFEGRTIQRLASKKVFLVFHAISGMLYNSSFFYYSGTVTTLEKHYKFSSTQIGYLGSMYDIVAVAVSLIAPYYISKGRFPRWMGFSLFCSGISNLVYILPYVFYGAGNDALLLTEEFGETFGANSTLDVIHQTKMKDLCYANKSLEDCSATGTSDAYLVVVVMFILSAAIGGFAGAIYTTLGAVYVDDNVKKSKAPMLLCLASFVRLLAPALGYSVASYCLKFYVTPGLHPKINDEDPRWIGAWWIGYVVFALVLFLLAPIMATFPKTLPRAALRKKYESLKMKSEKTIEKGDDSKSSLKDLLQTFKRLIKNKVYFCNTMAGVFYCFGYVPFWFFQAKYIQIHFLFTPSAANMVTGTVSLVFSAIGLLTAGIFISVFKPRARYLALWNVITSIFSVFGIVAYGYFSCTAGNNSLIMQNSQNFSSCNVNCRCDYVQYAPVCGENNVTYISPCHAGCSDKEEHTNGSIIFSNCSCVDLPLDSSASYGGSATTGACPVDCMPKFIVFFVILCINKFIGGTEGTSNFLLGMRCIDKQDKVISIGLSTAMVSLFAIVPSPIFFGWIIDKCCLFWGETCSEQGNCWLYDTDTMRYTLNMTAAGFVLIGTIFDVGTWYFSKDVQIFDEKEDELNIDFGSKRSLSSNIKVALK